MWGLCVAAAVNLTWLLWFGVAILVESGSPAHGAVHTTLRRLRHEEGLRVRRYRR